MKIAVIGCGALGSYYGALLSRAGHEVWFQLRADHDVVARDGVHVGFLSRDFFNQSVTLRFVSAAWSLEWWF
jgi:2-dehydropantoate 2-reductase